MADVSGCLLARLWNRCETVTVIVVWSPTGTSHRIHDRRRVTYGQVTRQWGTNVTRICDKWHKWAWVMTKMGHEELLTALLASD